MRDDKDELDLVQSVMDEYNAGKITLMEAGERLERMLPRSIGPSFLLSMCAMEALSDGRISPAKARRLVLQHADRHPVVPDLFVNCAFMQPDDQDHIPEVVGYMALAAEKSRVHVQSEEFERMLDNENFSFIRETLITQPEMATAWPYLGVVGSHLVKHFLVQDVSAAEGYLDPDLVEEIMKRPEDVGPVMANMCADLVGLEEEPPDSWVLMARLLGVLRPPEAVEAMVQGLEMAIDSDLHEAVLTLVKLADDYPELVAARMKETVLDPEQGEVRLNAAEVLGFRWREQGNLEFLYETLRALDPGDEEFDDMFRFLTLSLMRTGMAEAAREVERALGKYGRAIEPETAEGTRKLLGAFEPFDDDRAEHRALEDIYDLCCAPLEPEMRLDRMTITLMREQALSDEVDELSAEVEAPESPPSEWLRVGRNEPCPCGSGNKFKKCCLPAVREAAAAEVEAGSVDADPGDTGLIDKAVSFAHSRHRAEVESALGEFTGILRLAGAFDSGDDEPVRLQSVFIDWLLFGRRGSEGRTLGEEFARVRSEKLTADQLLLLKASIEGKFSVYEALEVYPEEGMRLRDIFRGGVFEVREKTATRSLAKWDLMGCRVGPMEDHYVVTGDVFPIPMVERGSVEKYVKRKTREAVKGGQVGDVDEFLERKGFLVAGYVRGKIDKMLRQPMPTLVTSEGDRYCRCVARYEVTDADATVRALEADPCIEEEPDAGTKGRAFAWYMSPGLEKELRAGEHVGPAMSSVEEMAGPREAGAGEEGPVRIFGLLSLRAGNLTLEAHSLKRLAFGKARLAEMLGENVRHKVDTIEDQEPLLEDAKEVRLRAGAESPGGGISPEAAREAVMSYLDEHYSQWPDTSLPALDGKTPRQAARTKTGRRKVNEVLKTMENSAGHAALKGQPAYDFSRIREELDIRSD